MYECFMVIINTCSADLTLPFYFLVIVSTPQIHIHTYINNTYIHMYISKFIVPSGAISSHAELQQLYMNDVHSDQGEEKGNMFAGNISKFIHNTFNLHTYIHVQVQMIGSALLSSILF